MMKKLSLAVAAMAVIACMFTGSASAATLYTTSAHKTPVTVGTTFTVATPTAGEFNYLWESGGTLWNACNSGTYTFSVAQNSAGVFKANVTSATLKSCALPTTPMNNGTYAQVTGSPINVGTGKAWLGATAYLEYTTLGQWVSGTIKSATGNPPVKGMSAQQPAAGAPVSLVFDKAPGLVASGGAVADLTASYTFTGPAASYSFG